MKVEFVNRGRSASIKAFSFGVVGTHTYLFVPNDLDKREFAIFTPDVNQRLVECSNITDINNLRAVRVSYPLFVNDYTSFSETGSTPALLKVENGHSLRNLNLPNHVSQFMLVRMTGAAANVELCVVSKKRLGVDTLETMRAAVTTPNITSRVGITEKSVAPVAVNVVGEPNSCKEEFGPLDWRHKVTTTPTAMEKRDHKEIDPTTDNVEAATPLKRYPKTIMKSNDFVHDLGAQVTEPTVLKPTEMVTVKTVPTSSVPATSLVEMGGLLYLGGEGVSRTFTVVASTDLPEMASFYDCNAVIVNGLKIISDTTPQSPYFSNDTSVKVDGLIDAVIFMQDCGFCVTGYKYRRQIGGGDLVVMMTTMRGKKERPSRKVIEDRLKAIFAI